MDTETVTIVRIGPTPALKVGAAVGLVPGMIYAVLDALVSGGNDRLADSPPLLVALFLMAVVGGGLSGLVMAWVYNLALRLTGGLQLEISVGPDEKDKGAPPSFGSMMSPNE